MRASLTHRRRGDFGRPDRHAPALRTRRPRARNRIPAMAPLLLLDEPAPHVRLLTLNRPEQLNTITAELCEQLHLELQRIALDRSCRAVVLTGAGRGFWGGLAPADKGGG